MALGRWEGVRGGHIRGRRDAWPYHRWPSRFEERARPSIGEQGFETGGSQKDRRCQERWEKKMNAKVLPQEKTSPKFPLSRT